MKKSMLEKQVREIKELREQLTTSPVVTESPYKSKGLTIVAMPSQGDSSSREYKRREQRRTQWATKQKQRVETKINTTLACKLQGFKAA